MVSPEYSPKEQRRIHDRLVDLVSQMSTVQLARQGALSDSDRKLHDQRVMILDREIDGLVHELYGLTDNGIKIVETGM